MKKLKRHKCINLIIKHLAYLDIGKLRALVAFLEAFNALETETNKEIK